MTACEKCRQNLGNVEDSICQKCIADADSELKVAENNFDKAGLEYNSRLNILYIDIEQ
jgi:hypothetical protein